MHICLVGLHWGDEGKGKIVDYLADRVDMVTRFQGGSNAGHTINVGGKIYKLSLIPSGVVRGKLCLIDKGVMLDPGKFLDEIEKLKATGLNAEPLIKVCDSTFLVLSLHKEAESFSNTSATIGTTKRGIGPAYEDKVGRRGVRFCDSQSHLKSRVELLVEHHNALRKGKGMKLLNQRGIIDEIEKFKEAMKDYLVDSDKIDASYSNNKVLFEGCQGILLDVDHGTYPYVTSSNTLPAQVVIGSSFRLRDKIFNLGVMKSYMTRVGLGPFPTQANGEDAEMLHKYGREIGTITERVRRCGWLDIPISRKAIRDGQIEGLAITKMDVLGQFSTIKICVDYNNGAPVYKEMPGWKSEQLKEIKCKEDLPQNARRYLDKIEELLLTPIYMISTGPERNEMLEIRSLIP